MTLIHFLNLFRICLSLKKQGLFANSFISAPGSEENHVRTCIEQWSQGANKLINVSETSIWTA